ncbi:MAG: TerC family protein [Phycisphaerales bacterium]
MLLMYAGFVVFVLAMLALDLFVVNRGAHEISIKRSLFFTGFTVFLALAFTGAIYWMYDHHWLGLGVAVPQLKGDPVDVPGSQAAVEFITGYLIEYSLSMDNIFVIAVIFAHFCIPAKHQHRVLFWGIIGALLMRGLMIAVGATALLYAKWLIYVFGAFLLYTGFKMLKSKEDDAPDLENNWTVKLARRFYPVTNGLREQHFLVTENGVRMMTPLFLTLLVVEATDVVFAVDSIPAIFGITRDPFIVFTSNIFAILGLRSLYFALSGAMAAFKYVKVSLSLVLMFVGAKMLLEAVHFEIDKLLSLGIIAGMLVAGVAASLLARPKATPTAQEQPSAPKAPECAQISNPIAADQSGQPSKNLER